MFTLEQKVIATVVVVGLNVTVFVLLGWFVVLTAVPSLLFLAAILTR
jgi:hypothetical protein